MSCGRDRVDQVQRDPVAVDVDLVGETEGNDVVEGAHPIHSGNTYRPAAASLLREVCWVVARPPGSMLLEEVKVAGALSAGFADTYG